MITSTIPHLRRLSPSDEFHYFFGYYDNPAYSTNDQLHLAHRVSFCDRWPQADDVAEIGFLERGKSTFTPLASTTAWNFQQGSMLQWFPNDEANEIIFNVRDKSTFGSCILNIANGRKKYYEMPVANVARQGRYALSINFSRLFDFRPGYGYVGMADLWKEKDHPEEDGIYLQDFRDGSAKLILSLQQIWECTRQWLPESNQRLVVNHLTFNPSGTRFVALVRFFLLPGQVIPGNRRTVVITANVDGSGLHVVKPGYIYASHYFWKNDDELLIYAEGAQGRQLYEWSVHNNEEHVLDSEFYTRDGHCSYSPDGRSVLYDSYPDTERYQHLSLYDLASRKPVRLGKLYSYPADHEARCDLHPRWNRAGNAVSLDSNHEGLRKMYELEIEAS